VGRRALTEHRLFVEGKLYEQAATGGVCRWFSRVADLML
jgi:hypothetical protein